jgi:flagellar biosynthesis component FlhA
MKLPEDKEEQKYVVIKVINAMFMIILLFSTFMLPIGAFLHSLTWIFNCTFSSLVVIFTDLYLRKKKWR